MIEGVTTIELTDVKTGKKEKIESKNMVTNAVRDIFKNPTYYNRTSMKNLMPFYSTLFGGIICADQSLQENANNYFLPSNASVIASGAFNYKNSSEDIVRGSYNSTDSEINMDEKYIKFVYDFTTNQGNGIIRSVCLTSWATGKFFGMGIDEEKIKDKYIKDTITVTEDSSTHKDRLYLPYYYNTSETGESNNNQYNLDINNIQTTEAYDDKRISKIFDLDLNNDKAKFFVFGQKIIKNRNDERINIEFHIEKHEINNFLTQAPSIFAPNCNENKYREDKINKIIINMQDDLIPKIPYNLNEEYKNFLLKTLGQNDYYGRVLYFIDEEDNNKINLLLMNINSTYKLFPDSASSDYVLFHFIINLNNNNIQYKNYKILSDNERRAFGNKFSYGNNDYQYYQSYNKKIYIHYSSELNVLDLNDYSFTTLLTGIYSILGYDEKHQYLYLIKDRTTNIDNSPWNRWNSYTWANYMVIYYDLNANKLKDTLFYYYSGDWGSHFITDKNNSMYMGIYTINGDSIGLGLGFRKDYLATINNLPEPIEKTQDKTMKITYTLREI